MNYEHCILGIESVFRNLNLIEYIKMPDAIITMDSLTMIELVVNLESQFNIEFDIDDLDLENFKTYNNIVNTIFRKLKTN